jgi:carotenoid cleavage dioxygenase-like enzyme
LEEKGRMAYRGPGSIPSSTTSLGAVRSVLAPAYGDGTANTCVVEYGNQPLALYGGGPPHLTDPKTLETEGIYTVDGRASRRRPFLAHTRVDHTRNRFVGCGWDSVDQFGANGRFIF